LLKNIVKAEMLVEYELEQKDMTEYVLHRCKLQKFYDDKKLTEILPESHDLESLSLGLTRVKHLN
jgi:hypothetical protein